MHYVLSYIFRYDLIEKGIDGFCLLIFKRYKKKQEEARRLAWAV